MPPRRRGLPPGARTARDGQRWTAGRSFATFADGVLAVEHTAGFFSVCSVTLVELMRAPAPVHRIDSTRALDRYRESTAGCLWDRFFAPPDPPFPTPDPEADLQGLPWSVNGPFRRFDLTALQPWVTTYFRPSDEVRARAGELAAAYGVDPDRTVGVWVRGTDKRGEVTPSPLEHYARRVETALGRGGVDRVLVQSDQAQSRDALLARFGDAAFSIDELPVTRGDRGIHFLDLPGRETHARDLLAVVVMLAGFRRLVLHSGNGGFWTTLLRGDRRGVRQLR